MKYWFLFLLMPLLLFSSCSYETILQKSKIHDAVEGTLDLKQWSFQEDGIALLSGEWEFYWMRFISPEEFSEGDYGQSDGYFKIPANWNGFEVDGEKLKGAGYATFRLRVLLPETNFQLGFIIPTADTSYRLYMNGVLIATNGVPGTNKETTRPQYHKEIVFFTPETNQLDMVFQIANFHHRVGGPWEPIYMGPENKIKLFKSFRFGFEVFLAGSIIIMFLYHLALYFIRPSEKSSLFFSLFCLLMGIRTIATGDIIISVFFPYINWQLLLKMVYLPYMLGFAALMSFIYHIYPRKLPLPVLRFYQIFGLAFGAIVLFTPASVFTYTRSIAQIFTVITGIYVIYITIDAMAHKDEGALIFFIGFLFLFLSIINDVLYAENFILFSKFSYLMPFGLFMLILCQSLMLSIRFSQAFNTAEILTSNLEKEVAYHTKELYTERNKLKVRNDIIENELRMAREIQKQLIPTLSPFPNVAFYYRPMELLGGDFLELIELPENKMGIFVSDVSGHGVPAALITSMIKSLMLEYSQQMTDPSRFLSFLNNQLVGHTGGNFITAFYGIYDLKKRIFHYANAGHNRPILIRNSEVNHFSREGKGLPLAIYNNFELSQIGKKLENMDLSLKPGDKVFLFTDGLLEAVNIHKKLVRGDQELEDFEGERLMDLLSEIGNLPANEFIRIIQTELLNYRGNDQFDDDVCMICLDVE